MGVVSFKEKHRFREDPLLHIVVSGVEFETTAKERLETAHITQLRLFEYDNYIYSEAAKLRLSVIGAVLTGEFF